MIKYIIPSKRGMKCTLKESILRLFEQIPYIVLKCYKPPGYIEGYPVVMIDIITDGGYVSGYATDRFLKTPRQLREDRIKEVLNEN